MPRPARATIWMASSPWISSRPPGRTTQPNYLSRLVVRPAKTGEPDGPEPSHCHTAR
jgi:hypothetical protein